MSLISIRNLEKHYGGNVILKDVNADIKKGEIISIIGSSGVGKSTFLRAVNFLDPPTGGEVFFGGEKLTKQNIDAMRHRLGMVFQDFGLFSHMTVLDNLIKPQVKLLKIPAKEAELKARALLKTVWLSDRARYYPHQLSGGQKQRVAIARCLAMSPEVILFDEPTNALDPGMTSEVMAVIRNLAKSGITMLIVTHEMDFARDMSSRVFYLDEKGIYEDGSPEQIFDKPQKPKTRAFIYNFQSFHYNVPGHDFDFAELLNKVEDFCYRHAIDKKIGNRLQLLAEELILNIITPNYGACSLAVSFSGKLRAYELSVTYGGEKSNALAYTEDEIAASIVRESAKTLQHTYTDNKNCITATI